MPDAYYTLCLLAVCCVRVRRKLGRCYRNPLHMKMAPRRDRHSSSLFEKKEPLLIIRKDFPVALRLSWLSSIEPWFSHVFRIRQQCITHEEWKPPADHKCCSSLITWWLRGIINILDGFHFELPSLAVATRCQMKNGLIERCLCIASYCTKKSFHTRLTTSFHSWEKNDVWGNNAFITFEGSSRNSKSTRKCIWLHTFILSSKLSEDVCLQSYN